MKQKLYGFKGNITPNSVIGDLDEEWEHDGISLSVKNGVFEINYLDKDEEDKARKIADTYLYAWSLKHNTKINADFNHSWGPKEDGGKNLKISLSENIKVSDRVIVNQVSFDVKARIVGKFDSSSFVNEQELVEKSINNESLRKALEFFSEEVVDEKRPLYGVYKAIEELTHALGGSRKGREALGRLAGCGKRYVSELMGSTQHQRHAKTKARKIFSEHECRSRANELIEAYADSI